MVDILEFSFLILAFQIINILLLIEFEFRIHFEKRLFGLRPSDFRKGRIYGELLDDVLSKEDVFKAQRFYVIGSMIILNIVTGLITCSKVVREGVQQIFPPVLFSILEKAKVEGNYNLNAFFYHLLFFTFCFHALPFVVIVMNRLQESGIKERKSNTEDKIIRLLMAFFGFLQYFLNRTISKLLRDQPIDYNGLSASGKMSLAGRIKATIANKICRDVPEEIIRKEYNENRDVLDEPELTIPTFPHRANTEIGLNNIVCRFIEKHGIPGTQSRFSWRKKIRNSTRKPISQSITARIQGCEIRDVLIENIGKDKGFRKKWRSMLLLTERIEQDVKCNQDILELTQLGDIDIDRPVKFKVTRVTKKENSLYMAVVVMEEHLERFHSIMSSMFKNGSLSFLEIDQPSVA